MKFVSDILAKAGLVVDGNVTLNSVANATTDTDKFLTIESSVVKYRTGTQLLSDIGGQPLLTNPITGTGTAGQVAFYTGSTTISGDSGLFWDNTNKRLGISATTPYTSVQIGSGSGAKYLGIVDTADATYNIGYIGRNGDKLHIGFSNSNTSISERNAISIDSPTLYVGIGVSAPVNRLQIGSMGTTGFSGNHLAFGNGAAATAFFQGSSSTQMYLSTYLAIMPSGSGTGNLVVGSLTNSGYRLDVVGTFRVTSTVTFDSIANATSNLDRFLVSDAGILKYRTAAQLLSDIGAQAALTNPITGTGSSGRVAYWSGTTTQTGTNNFFWDAANNRLGVGTNNPQRVIEIYSTTADSHLRISGVAPSVSLGEANTGSIYQVKFGLATVSGHYVSAAVPGDFVIISQTASILWVTSTTEKMRLNYSGNLSIGNTNDTYKLDVSGIGRFTGAVLVNNANTGGLRLNRDAATNYNGIYYATANSDKWFIGMRENLLSNNHIHYSEYLGADVLTLNQTTGAATFSSSVTAGGLVLVNNNHFRTSGAYTGNQYYNSAAATNEKAWMIQPSGDHKNFLVGTMDDAFSGMVQQAINILRSGTSISNVCFPNGNVGIGTTSPNSALEVNGVVRATRFGGSGYPYNGIFTGLADASYAELSAGSTSGYYTGITTFGGGYATPNIITFTTASAERMRINSGGDLELKGRSTTANYQAVFYNDNSQLAINATDTTGAKAINFNPSSSFNAMSIGATGQIKFSTYTSSSAWTGTAVATLAVDSSGNVITITGGGGSSQWTTSGSNIYYTTGNVGIGTTSPTPHNGNNALIVKGGTGRGIIELWDATSGKSVFQNVGGDTYIGQLDKGTGAGTLYLLVNGTGTSASVAMTMLANGSVSIGTTNPNIYGNSFVNQFTVSTTSGYANISVAGAAGNGGGIDFGNQTVRQAGVYGLDGSHLGFYTNGSNSGNGLTERMRITAGGNVGIGTSSPIIALSVRKDIGDWIGQFKNYGSAAYGLTIDLSGSTGGTLGYVFGAYSQVGTGLFLQNNGKVGIGTTSPLYKLHVDGDITFAPRNTVGTYRIGMGREDGTGWSYTQHIAFANDGSGGYIAFSTQQPGVGGGEYMRINYNGNVGIGTTSPSYLLQVNGTGYYNSNLTVNGNLNMVANNSYINIDRSSTAGDGLLVFKTASSNRWLLGAWGNTNNNFYLYSYGLGGAVINIDYSTGAASFASSITCTSLTETSTIKVKENIVSIDSALDQVEKLQAVSYNRKGSSVKEIGLIAEAVEEVYPEFVQYDQNGEPVGLNYSRLTAVLIESVKELKNRIQQLENRN